jgi:3-oxoadipate enol-lactonase/4-carboxymuconolactone decarboxylase
MPMIAVNGVNLFYDLAGPDGAPVVAFSNSLGTSAEMWDAQARALAGRCRVLRYDTRGHGRSSTAGPVSIKTLADDLIGLLDALSISSVHMVGLSLGGMTAQALAIHHPARIRSLLLMATDAYLPPRDGWELRARTVREQGLGAIVDAAMGRWFTPESAITCPEKVRFARSRFVAGDAEGYALCCEAIAAMDLRPQLSGIKHSTLVVAGRHDPVTTPDMCEALSKVIPGAGFQVVDGASHLIAMEQAEAVNALLVDWLDHHGALLPAPHRGSFEAGLANRKAVLGIDHVQRSLAQAGPFTGPWQDFITRNAWGEMWGDPTLPFKLRSCVTLAMMIALHREEEFKLHVRPALKNGVTLEELRALLLHASIYAGVPATNAAFRWMREVLGEALDEVTPA